jgi:hypothetical protein
MDAKGRRSAAVGHYREAVSTYSDVLIPWVVENLHHVPGVMKLGACRSTFYYGDIPL